MEPPSSTGSARGARERKKRALCRHMQWLFATLQTSSHHTMSSSPLDARVAALEQALQHLLANSVPSHFMPGVSKPQDEQEFSPKMKAAEHTSNAEFASLAADTLERIDAEKDESPSHVATEEAPTIDDADDSPTSIAEDKQDLHAAADTSTPSIATVGSPLHKRKIQASASASSLAVNSTWADWLK